jgi:UPF0755 protein
MLGDLPATVRTLAGRWDAPASEVESRQVFTVQPGQSASEIGTELYARGLIRSPIVFRMLVETRGVGARIEAGEYTLSPTMSTNEIITVLSRGAVRRGVTVTIPEGWRAEQAAQKIETLGLATAPDVMAVVRAPQGLPVGDLVPPGQSLEGYLFPDTYEVDREADARRLVEMMVRQFNSMLTPELRRKAAGTGLSVHQAVTLASIVEREAAQPEERPIVASVYLNRLRAGMPLQADPTVQFAVASANLAEALGFGFWKRDLTLGDLQFPSPYNTYTNRGLPPGPICSPGLDALEAVLSPAQTDYYYFVARGDGSHAFARSEPEHRENVDRYQRAQ